jgi:hypothetical protein
MHVQKAKGPCEHPSGLIPLGHRLRYGIGLKPCPDCHNFDLMDLAWARTQWKVSARSAPSSKSPVWVCGFAS